MSVSLLAVVLGVLGKGEPVIRHGLPGSSLDVRTKCGRKHKLGAEP